MSRKGSFHALLTGAVFLLAMGGAVAEGDEDVRHPQEFHATISSIRERANKVDAASDVDRKQAKKDLLDSVSQAIAAAKNADEVKKIIEAAVTAAPRQAAEIVDAAIKAAPSRAADITQAAVAAAPTQAVDITVAALDAAPDQAKAIINAATAVAPHDSTTVSELQSLSTRSQNAITHEHNMPNETPPASGGRSTASPA